MGVICVPGNHVASSQTIRNQGLEFGSCRRCGHDLIRSRGDWRRVPRGFRVVWRHSAPAEPVSAAQLNLNLPASGRTLALAARPPRRKSRLAVAGEIMALGARGFAWAMADRLRSWAKSLCAPRIVPRPALSLPAG